MGGWEPGPAWVGSDPVPSRPVPSRPVPAVPPRTLQNARFARVSAVLGPRAQGREARGAPEEPRASQQGPSGAKGEAKVEPMWAHHVSMPQSYELKLSESARQKWHCSVSSLYRIWIPPWALHDSNHICLEWDCCWCVR